MKFRTLAKWDDPEKTKSLVFFAQLLEEMSFDFSLDTYKPSVLHAGLLCQEASLVISEIENGNIKDPNLEHVLAELCKNLESDIVAQSLIPLTVSSLFPVLKPKKPALREVETVIDLLEVSLNPSAYRERTEGLLLEEITTHRRFAVIRKLARSYITHLIAHGYHPRFIRECVHEFFWYGPTRISDVSAISDFYRYFGDVSEFEIVFKVDKVLAPVGDTFADMGLSFSTALPNHFDVSKFHEFNNPQQSLVFALIKVRAKDIFSAREIGERKLDLACTLHTLYHHKVSPKWSPDCVVRTASTGAYRKIGQPRSPMQKCRDVPTPLASVRVRAMLDGFTLELDSFSKFTRSAQLHSMALASESQENQILNIWIALESLVPTQTKSDNSANIEHVCSSLINFLNVDYIESLINNLVKDLLRWNSSLVRALLRRVPGKRFSGKLARILVVNEYADVLSDLEAATKDFFLLRDRLDYFKTILATPHSVSAALDAHKQRLEWQIRRIYRARNIIVHTGTTPPYTRALIEHAHDYLDTIMNALMRLASTPKKINSVSQGFKYVELRYREYYEALVKKQSVFDDANIETLMFGSRG